MSEDHIPGDKELIIKLAFELKKQGRFEEAIQEFQKVLNFYEQDGQIHLMVSMLFNHELKKYEEALPHAQKAVELLPKLEKASLNLCHCYADLGMQDEAENEISRYVKNDGVIQQYQILFDENGMTKEDFM